MYEVSKRILNKDARIKCPPSLWRASADESGRGGIRTPGTVSSTPHFECGPFGHSGTLPFEFNISSAAYSTSPRPFMAG